MSEKKYFWFQMKTDWYNDIQIKRMMKQNNGDTMVVIYHAMIGLSCEDMGVIHFQEVCDTIEEEIAESINKDVEEVDETLKYLKKNKLALEWNNNDLYLPHAPEMIRSRTSGADRVAKYREKMKRLKEYDLSMSEEERDEKVKEIHNLDFDDNEDETLQCNGDVTESNTDVTNSNTDIEKSIEDNIYTLEKESDGTSKNNTQNNNLNIHTEVHEGDREKEVVRGKGERGNDPDTVSDDKPKETPFITIKAKDGNAKISLKDYETISGKYPEINVDEVLMEIAEFYDINPDERVYRNKIPEVIKAWCDKVRKERRA